MTKSIYDPEHYDALLNRIHRLNPDSTPGWGKMDVGQMLAHCAEVQEVMNGKQLQKTPFLAKLFRGVIKKAVLSTKVYGKNSQTHPQYMVVTKQDFDSSKNRFLGALNVAFSSTKEEVLETKHALFGQMTVEEKGWASYKHHDHHLKQFGV
jgi:hypothetical protein